MKKNYLGLLTLLLLVTNHNFGQVTVKIESGSYTTGGNVGTTIDVYKTGDTNLNLNISLKRPSGQAVNGYVYVYSKRSSSSPAISVGGSQYVSNTSWGTSFLTTRAVTLSASNFNNSGSYVYAEFKSTSNISYKSSNKTVKLIDRPTISGDNNSVPLNLNSVLRGAFEIEGNGVSKKDLVIESDSNSPIRISGNEPSFGTTKDWFYNKQYSQYTWQRKIDKIEYITSNRGSYYKIIVPGRWQYLTNKYPRYDFRNTWYTETSGIQYGYLYSYKRYVTGTLQSTNKRVRIYSNTITVRKKRQASSRGGSGPRSGDTRVRRLQTSLSSNLYFDDEASDNMTLALFPNPSSSYLGINTNLDLSNSTVSIYDLSGKIVLTEKLQNSYEKINIEALTDGNYIFSIETKNGKVVKHFVKD
ncbi:T9SS type A sorting domain-containing protein [Maribacter sp. R77961]|uniref:T9SS type A sorting domain-containing protein n=1 Tax=Maribacter sp. R77961 TaxID=3093871 RepID=UPI0037C84EF3